MSRLDTFIRRLQAQRMCLDLAADLTAGVPGPVLELGLGNGRTYDHLRELLPDREIFVFERQPMAHPDCVPDREHLIVGDLRDTLPDARRLAPEGAALVHSDIGTGEAARNARLADWLASVLPLLVAPGGVVASDQPLEHPDLEPLPLPSEVPARRYFLYRRVATSMAGSP
jgi:hypothetical protein